MRRYLGLLSAASALLWLSSAEAFSFRRMPRDVHQYHYEQPEYHHDALSAPGADDTAAGQQPLWDALQPGAGTGSEYHEYYEQQHNDVEQGRNWWDGYADGLARDENGGYESYYPPEGGSKKEEEKKKDDKKKDEKEKRQHKGRLFATDIELAATTSDNPFRTAWNRQLAEQSLINNIPKEVLNATTRIIGWFALEMLFYGGQGIFDNPNKRKRK